MAASRKRPAVGADDRLSALPDCLIHDIMSSLTAQEAVQTCVLSRRWKNLWRSMPCLDIDQRMFRTPPTLLVDSPRRARFVDFVDNLLKLHSAPSLDTFRLQIVNVPASGTEAWKQWVEAVERWVSCAIERRPTAMEIDPVVLFYQFPHLGATPSRLKRLHLVGFTLDETFTLLLASSGFPVLEDLALDQCKLADPAIACCTVRNLTIEYCMNETPHYDLDECSALAVTAPALACLHLATALGSEDDFLFFDVMLKEMQSLVKATVELLSRSTVQTRPCNLLCGLINVRDLELSGERTLENLHYEPDDFPVFHNLTTLLFVNCDLSDRFEILECFLNNAPNLEKLTLQSCKLPEGSNKRKRSQDTLKFQCPKLKWTEIKYREDDVDKLFDLLLGVWRSLRKTTILLKKA